MSDTDESQTELSEIGLPRAEPAIPVEFAESRLAPGKEATSADFESNYPRGGRLESQPASGKHAPLALRKNFSWVLIGNMLYAVCNWSMTISLAKMGSPTEVGYYQAGVAVTQPIILAAMLQLRSVMLTDQSGKYRYGQYLALRIVTTLAAMAFMIGTGFVVARDPITRLVIVVTGFGVCWDAISDILYGFVQRYQRMERMGISLVIKGFLSIGLFVLFYRHTHSVVWAVLGSALGSLLTVCCWDIPATLGLARALKRLGKSGPMLSLRPSFEPAALWELTSISFALGCTIVVVTFNTYVTRYFVLGELGVASMGIYSSIASLVNIVGTMLMSLMTAAVPPMTVRYQDNDRKGFDRIFNKCLLVSAALGGGALLVSLLFGHAVLHALFSAVYATHANLFTWMMLAGFMFYVSWPMTNGLTVFRAFSVQLWTALVAVVVSAAASFVLVPRFGLTGAAWAFIASMTVRLVISAWAYRVELHKRLPA